MALKAFVAAAALAAFGLPVMVSAADAPATKTVSAHKKSCFDAPWQSPEWQACEAKMQASQKKS